MSANDKSTMTESRRYQKLTIQDLLQFISSILLPLMLIVFTIIVTIRQEQMGREQRLQDLNNSAQQRAEDRQMASEQRNQDKTIAQQQREHDLKIASDERDQDDLLAEKHRDLLDKQRQHELKIEAIRYEKEHEKYLDTLLMTYINEIGALILDYNGSLTSNRHIANLVRSKTLAITRQLDPERNTQILEFLYEAGQLNNGENPLDLSNANFNGIHLKGRTRGWSMRHLYLYGVHLKNASFSYLDLTNANFSYAHLHNASFNNTSLDQVDFTSSILFGSHIEDLSISRSIFKETNMANMKFKFVQINSSQFIDVTMRGFISLDSLDISFCNFTRIRDLHYVNFSRIQIRNTIFEYCDMRNNIFTDSEIYLTSFRYTNLNESDFSKCTCTNNQFDQLHLNQISFVNASLDRTTWFECKLHNIDFNGASFKWARFLKNIELINVSLVNIQAKYIHLAKVKIVNSDFRYCQCQYADFSRADVSNVSFDYSKLDYANFSSADLWKGLSFVDIDGYQTDFSQCALLWSDFNHARLRESSFRCSTITATSFINTDLTNSDFSGLSIDVVEFTKSQFDSMLSKTGMMRGNEKLRNPNLLRNTGLECDPIEKINRTFWQIEPDDGEITIIKKIQNCFFNVSQPMMMRQHVSILHYQRLIEQDKAQGEIWVNIWNNSASIYVTAGTKNYSFEIPQTFGFQMLRPKFPIPYGTKSLLLSVIFPTTKSQCGYIDLSIQSTDINC